MKNVTNKRSAYLLLLFVWSIVPLMAQNEKTKGNKSLFSLPSAEATKSTREQMEEANTERKRSAWLKAPYLTTPLSKATVGELTTAFEAWSKDHPEEANPNRRRKDDEIVKFQRKLYNWQMQNSMNEVPVGVQQRMDAFTSYDLQNPQPASSNFTNADGNWRLLGPTSHPVDIPFTEPALSANQSMANSGIGRINCIEFSNSDTMNVWVGTSAGGVWKTWNGGKTWINISQSLPIMEISDIAIDQSNSNIIYLATGDRDGQGGYYGNGSVASRLYKTTDGVHHSIENGQ